MSYTNQELELAEVEQLERQDTANRASTTINLRAKIFRTWQLAKAYFAKQGQHGTKKICISINAIGDANQLHYLKKMSVAQIAETLIMYETLKATGGGSTGKNPPSSRVIGIMAHSLYQADELQRTGEVGYEDDALGSAPYKQAPRYPLSPNLGTGVVSVEQATE